MVTPTPVAFALVALSYPALALPHGVGTGAAPPTGVEPALVLGELGDAGPSIGRARRRPGHQILEGGPGIGRAGRRLRASNFRSMLY
ncbi:hypothetical protein Tco_0929509 [Tanacetum coccineum]